MKTITSLLPVAILALSGVLLSPVSVSAQAPAAGEAKKEMLVDVDKVNVEIQKTPQFNVPNVKEKRFTPKDWIELEVDCKAKLSKDEKDKNMKAYPVVEFKYYAYLSGNPDVKKNRVVTGSVTHVNVPVNEVVHSVMYISPATVLKITEGKPVAKTMVEAWGVAVFINGNEVGRKTSKANKEWWKDAGLPPQETALLTKKNTPFAPLWYDYHLEEQTK